MVCGCGSSAPPPVVTPYCCHLARMLSRSTVASLHSVTPLLPGGPEDQDEPPAPAPEELLSPAAVSPPPAPAPPESPGAGSVVSDTARSPYSSLATTWTGMSGGCRQTRVCSCPH